ncbi:acyl-CoA dehydrogenase family protein [Mucilaginibacter paludis]|uniref:Acyl-CoA dehydrogenase type 2 domain-containing protein n=1 Tax=Mucilaginibacter paludis DSM 18603 TaxID=714943 RepID=H1Y4Q5_9SPHI|nr:acyl-CoA dehydrogenase family protein [Mucilaginibacter paludis]EHQ28099.1 Acyl-CoA dehydrogenase type 2 domain-containing protein [Mucilaginibacter paludis DSM 18603]
MHITSHPSNILQQNWIDTIRGSADAAEQARQLLPEQLELIYQQRWFNIITPKEYGGLELDLNQEVRLIEALSWADGSLGWVATLCSGAAWFAGFLNPQLAVEIFADRTACLAGSGAPSGTAAISGDGYIINGTWKYASGALNTTHFTANCRIMQNGLPVLNPEGEQLIIPFVFKKDEVKVIPAWNYMGMVATGSHSFEVNQVWVPASRSFRIDPDFMMIHKPQYAYPFLQLAEATIAVNISGMAIHFIDLCKATFAAKRVNKNLTEAQDSELNEVFEQAVHQLNDTRNTFYEAVDRSWLNYADGDTANQAENLQSVSDTSRKLAKSARQVVNELYPYCGLEAAKPSSEINRVWRDIHTASQHAVLTFAS